MVVESFHKCFKYMEVVSSYIIHSEMTDIKIAHLEFHRQSTTFLLWEKRTSNYSSWTPLSCEKSMNF